ncbi:MAG: CooT family nickel-binding protein [Oscillospiraceae bacterium]|jgi:predicted RNA-binding protein|nr:CooT family nickel-binding protein [Oscillospiraceae bacterium]MCI8759271.1 CooT family nickel-binding protein [Oscillospiraceae bacterium]
MCLSTIYRNEKQDGNILCRFVASITADGDKLTFVDVMGETTTITGRLVSADLTAGSVIVASE